MIAKVAKPNPSSPAPKCSSASVVRQLVGREPEGDDERQVEQQLERRGRAVALVRVAPVHPGSAVLEQRGHADMVSSRKATCAEAA